MSSFLNKGGRRELTGRMKNSCKILARYPEENTSWENKRRWIEGRQVVRNGLTYLNQDRIYLRSFVSTVMNFLIPINCKILFIN
jgi:hypothetical protein